ncbi:MAG: iron-sulfur cluster carrier protein ApbC [Proteobacteria bacterium]|nr:iron-sulfur cluster carrier protein ApbC [Pseudomonadota bacterium]
MVAPTPSQISAILGTIYDPYLGQDLVSAKVIHEIAIDDKTIAIHLQFSYPCSRGISELKQRISQALATDWPQYAVSLNVNWKVRRHKTQKETRQKLSIKNIIAVASGKGGVGKSTVAVNLALALRGLGARVALLDADIYGPSQPHMLGKPTTRATTLNKKFIPVESLGIQSISIGYLVGEQSPMVWRGPMASGALQQLLQETAWEDCDYMILDLPPGTGDIQLTMAQKIPISGAVIVTTPQDIALIDAHRACKMFEKLEVSVLGIVENMSWHHCSACGHQEAIFGQGGGEKMAKEFELPLLAQLPLHAKLRELCDAGLPIVASSPQSALAAPYWEMALKVAGQLALKEVNYSALIPEIVITKSKSA